MRILLVTSFFPPEQTAGTEMRTLAYALSLQKLGHEVQVICAGEWYKGDRCWNGYVDEIYQGIPVRRLHLNWMQAPDPNLYLYNNPIIKDHFVDFLTSWRPQIMHITSCVSLSASVIEAAKHHQIPVVLTLTDFWFICPRVNLLKSDLSLCDGRTTALECLKCMMNNTKIYVLLNSILPQKISDRAMISISKSPLISRHRGMRGMAFDMEHRKAYLSQMIHTADYVTAPSRALGDTINLCAGSGVDKIIYSGHDLSWMQRLKKKKQTDRLRISYIGQIIPLKGVHVLLSAFILAGIAGQAELVIYGDTSKEPQYVAGLHGRISGFDACIRFGGAFSHEQLGEVLTDVDLLVVPSLWHENNPRIIQEAFAAKIPVISSNVEGISEFVEDGINGLLFERGSTDDLSKLLQRITSEAGLLERLRTGIKPVKTIDEEIAEFDRIYNDLIDRVASVSG